MVRQILGAVSQFDKTSLVAKLRQARERVKATKGRCEGRRPVPATVVAEARRLASKNPRAGQRRSLLAGICIANAAIAWSYETLGTEPWIRGVSNGCIGEAACFP